MNPYNPSGNIPRQNAFYPMGQLQEGRSGNIYNSNQPNEVVGGYDANINPMTGQEIPSVNMAGGGMVPSQSGLASLLASRGRGGDSMLVHMNPEEVKGLQALALAHGGSLSINPETGLVEANFLKKILPTVAGFTLNALFPGLGTVGTSLAVAGVTGLAEGSFSKGLKAGLGAYSGASIREALSRVAAEKAARESLEALGTAQAAATREVGKEALGLTKEAVELPAQSVRGLQVPAMRLTAPPMVMPGLSSETIRGLASAAGDVAAAARPSFGQLGQGLRSLTQRGGLENFVTALGGPNKAGFVMAPITSAIEEAELEEQERKMRRAQQADEFPYYIPGAFDFNTGTFGQGYYRTKSGRPYTPKPFGFADGGIVDLPIMVNPKTMSGVDPVALAAQPAFNFPQPPETRREIVDQYIADLNARLARGLPKYTDTTPAPPSYFPPFQPPTTPVAPPTTPPFRPIPIAGQPVDDVVAPPIEPEIVDYFPVFTPPPYIRYPEPTPEPEKTPGIEIEAEPEVIAPDYTGVPIVPVSSLVSPPPPPPAPAPAPEEKDKIPSVEIEALPETIIDEPIPDYSYIPIVPVSSFVPPPPAPAPEPTRGEISVTEVDTLPPRLGIEELYRGVPIYDTFDGRPIQIPLETKIDDIGIDPNVTKALEEAKKEAAKEEKPSLVDRALDLAEATGGGLGALVGAGRELFGGDTSLRDLIEAAARGYIPDYIEEPATKGLAYVEKVLTPEEAAQADAEAAAKKEQESKQVEPEQVVLGGGGGGDLGMDYGGPTNYFDNSIQNFLDQYFMDQMMGGGRGVVTVEELSMASGGPVKRYSAGGIGSLPQYRAGGKYLQGPGDGMSDDIKANIEGRQEARLADGEFVIPADVVSHLGNGSSNAGAKKLHQMMARVRQARTGKKKQAPAVKVDRYLPA